MESFTSQQQLLSFIIPVYNEEKNISLIYEKIHQVMQEINTSHEKDRLIPFKYEFIFVNDGSQDQSLFLLSKLSQEDKRVKYINFSRNFGHQAALTAGLQYAKGDAIVTLDCDLQDPPEIILEMVKKWQLGNDIVYARRRNRHDSFLKKYTAIVYYKLLNKFSDVKIPRNVGDFRLMDKKVAQIINNMPEKSRYLRGMVAWVGFQHDFVDFDRPERIYGKTGYTLSKMVRLAMDGLFNFSLLPLRVGLLLGTISIILGICFIIYMIGDMILHQTEYPLYKFLTVILFIFMGFSFIINWIMGEYIGRVYEEIKHRPLYIIENTVNFNEPEKTEI